jgi:predicted glutamine amidotransferase
VTESKSPWLQKLAKLSEDIVSDPLTDDASWAAFQTGELEVYRKGELIGRLQTMPAWTAAAGEKGGECEQTI